MRYLKFVVLVIAITQFLSGCDKALGNLATKKELDEARAALSSTQAALSASQAELGSLRTTVERLESRLQTLELKEIVGDWKNVAYLTPGGDGYSEVQFSLGVLTVQIADVKPYASGSKVVLRFGNTLSATIDGLKAEIDWGQVGNDGVPHNESAKTKKFTFVQSLRPGSWTEAPVILDDTPPSELGFVRVHNVTHTGINLFKK